MGTGGDVYFPAPDDMFVLLFGLLGLSVNVSVYLLNLLSVFDCCIVFLSGWEGMLRIQVCSGSTGGRTTRNFHRPSVTLFFTAWTTPHGQFPERNTRLTPLGH